MKFFARMLTVFFALHRPDSTMAKPRFMKKTRNAVTSTQRVSRAIRSVLVSTVCVSPFASEVMQAFCRNHASPHLPGRPADGCGPGPPRGLQ